MTNAPPAFAENVEDIGPPPIDLEDNQYAVERLLEPKSARAASIGENSVCVCGSIVRKVGPCARWLKTVPINTEITHSNYRQVGPGFVTRPILIIIAL
jgi:hypothetical protein